MSRTVPTTLVLMAIGCLVLAANLTKPVHMDDTAYLAMARAVLRAPWHPMSQPFNWGQTSEPLAVINQPLLVPWLLAGVIALAGESQPLMHAMISLWTLGALLVFHRLARRFAPSHALWLTALLGLGPAVLPAQNLMVDLPLLALWLLFFSALLQPGAAGRGQAAYARAACCLAAALLTKYNTLALLPLLLGVMLWRRHWRALVWLLIPLGTLAAWTWFNLHDFGGAHLLGRSVPPPQPLILFYRVLLWIGCLGALVPCGFAFTGVLADRARRTVLAAGLFGACVATLAYLMGNTPSLAVLWGLFSANGALLLMVAEHVVSGGLGRGAGAEQPAAVAMAVAEPAAAAPAKSTVTRESIVILVAWVMAAAAFAIALAPFLAARHVLLALPAVLLLLGLGLEQAGPLPRLGRHAGLALTVLLGLWLAWADAAIAGAYRAAPARLKSALPHGARVYQVGHWGWQWYAQQAGLPEYDPQRTRLEPGDYLIIPEWISRQTLPPADAIRLELASRYEVDSTPLTWLRSVSWEPFGGLYMTVGWHQAPPWFFQRGPLASFRIERVVGPPR